MPVKIRLIDQIYDMEPGDQLVLKDRKWTVVRSTASQIAKRFSRKYATSEGDEAVYVWRLK